MRVIGKLVFVLAIAAAEAAEAADPSSGVTPVTASPEAIARAQEIVAIKQRIGATRSRNSDAAITAAGPVANDYIASPYRAYAPSCLGDGLPLDFSGPLYRETITLGGDPSSPTERDYRETVTLTVWRVPCSSGTSATVFGIDRPDARVGQTDHVPVFPGVRIQQGNVPFDDQAGRDLVRIAVDPNTLFSTVYPGIPIIYNITYSLENFISNTIPLYNFDLGFQIRFDSFINGPGRQKTITIPAYNAANYPAASQPLPISGYLSSNWGNPLQNGEGILTQVFELGTDGTQRALTFAWFTYDSSGTPYWLFGTGIFAIGARSVAVPTYYLGGGSFASQSGTGATANLWGSVTFSFPNCNTARIQYQSSTNAAGVPTGAGDRNWARVGEINSITCNK